MSLATLSALVRDGRTPSLPRTMAGSHTPTLTATAHPEWQEMLQWQATWRAKFRRGLTFYFDTPSLVQHNNNLRRVSQARIATLERKVRKHGGTVLPVMPSDATDDLVVVSAKPGNAPAGGPGPRTWDLDKLTRFFQNYERDLRGYAADTARAPETPRAAPGIHTLTGTPHVYLYDAHQRCRPLVARSWDVALLNRARKERLPYPVLQRAAVYGRCPFARAHEDPRAASERRRRRYARDCANERYALKLRALYRRAARPASGPVHAAALELQPHGQAARLYAYFRVRGARSSQGTALEGGVGALQRAHTALDVAFNSFSERAGPTGVPVDFRLDGHAGAPSSSGDNDSLSSNDTVATLTLSELEETHEPRTSLRNLSLGASRFSSQQDSAAVNEGVPPSAAEVQTPVGGVVSARYCENCHRSYAGTVRQHACSADHAERAGVLDFARVDAVIAAVGGALGGSLEPGRAG